MYSSDKALRCESAKFLPVFATLIDFVSVDDNHSAGSQRFSGNTGDVNSLTTVVLRTTEAHVRISTIWTCNEDNNA